MSIFKHIHTVSRCSAHAEVYFHNAAMRGHFCTKAAVTHVVELWSSSYTMLIRTGRYSTLIDNWDILDWLFSCPAPSDFARQEIHALLFFGIKWMFSVLLIKKEGKKGPLKHERLWVIAYVKYKLARINSCAHCGSCPQPNPKYCKCFTKKIRYHKVRIPKNPARVLLNVISKYPKALTVTHLLKMIFIGLADPVLACKILCLFLLILSSTY